MKNLAAIARCSTLQVRPGIKWNLSAHLRRGGLNFYANMIQVKTFFQRHMIRDAPLDFKGGGSRKFGSGQVFFFLQPGKESFLFSIPNGASFFFFFLSSRWDNFFLFFLKFFIQVCFNTRFQMKLIDKQNITCINIKYVVVCVYCEQFVLFLRKYCYQYSFNLFEERTSCFRK